ncbi:MAG: 4-amino-4-deoxy-L-arabinose transferase-like glycosyltransferase [Pseudohongiellaceae bacterium]|jgi:4-amino-4-deoxy-L-arabinose transferase-like glycosyltransferase
MTRLAWLAVIVGLALRALSACHHEAPRGDVVLDVGVARSLSDGSGFRSGFVRGVPVVVGAETPVPPQGWADQHPPLWPVVGAVLSFVTGDAFSGLKLGSWLAGLALLLLVWRCGERLTEGLAGAPEGLGACAAAVVALTFVMVDAGGNGSLYSAQAALVLALVELLAAPRRSLLGAALPLGIVLAAAALLNHQALVLLPVPLVARLLAARRGEFARAWAVGLLSIFVASLCMTPWWVRNFSVFGAANHSVNDAYLLYKAGAPLSFVMEQGAPVIRLMNSLSLVDVVRAMVGFARGNLVYLAVIGLCVLPCLGGVLLAGLPRVFVEARQRRDVRLLTLLVCVVVLGAVTLLWPAAKLRYAVTLTPLLALLAVRILASTTTLWERRFAVVVVVAWLLLLLGTLDDVTGTSSDPRPTRWWSLAVGGALLLVLPLWWRLRTRADPQSLQGGGLQLALLCGLPIALMGTAVTLSTSPGTAYHSAVFADDAFGHHVEQSRASTWSALAAAHELLEEQGAVTVLGPIELLAWPEPTLVELPRGTSPEILSASLESVLERGLGDHLVLSHAEAESIEPGELTVGSHWFGGRLELIAWVSGDEIDGALHCVSRVLAP